jgi:hypothetical protein
MPNIYQLEQHIEDEAELISLDELEGLDLSEYQEL